MLAPLTAEQQARFDAALAPILARYPSDQKASAMLPALRIFQEMQGHITDEAMQLVAGRLGVPSARAREVASFYVMLFDRPMGRHVIDVCTNVSCSLRGAEKVLGWLERRLGIRSGGTTKDGLFTLRETECLASCGTAPCLQINEQHHEHLTPKKLDELIDRLADG